MRILLLATLFLVLIPASLGIEASFTSKGATLEWIQSQGIYTGTLTFTLNEELTSVRIDATPLNSLWEQFRGIKDYQNLVANCNKQECRITGIEFRPNREDYILRGIGNNEEGQQSFTLDLEFKTDDTAPTITSIETEKCDQEKCFVKTGENTITIKYEDSVGELEYKRLYYNYGGTVQQVGSCENNKCIGIVDKVCNQGTEFEIKLAALGGVPSQDDAGNTFQSNIKTKVVCDNNKPTIENITYNPIPATTQTPITVKAIIQDDQGILNTNAYSPELEETAEGNCNEENYCEFIFNDLPETYTKARITISAKDYAGNEAENKTIEIDILEEESGEEPDFFRTIAPKTITLTPNKINRVILQLSSANNIPYKIKANYPLKEKPGTNPILVDTSIRSCNYIGPNGPTSITGIFNKPEIEHPSLKHTEGNGYNTIIFTLNPDVFKEKEATTKLLDNNFRLNCTIGLEVIDNKTKTIYKAKEKEPLIIQVNAINVPVGEVGEVFAKKIRDKQEYIKDYLFLIDIANRATATLSDICNIQKVLGPIQTTGATIEALGKLLTYTVVLAGVGNNIVDTGNAIYLAPALINNKLWGGDIEEAANAEEELNLKGKAQDLINGLMRKSCRWSSCAVSGAFESPENAGFRERMQNELLGGLDTPNVENSVYAAITQQCWPAVVFHANKYRQMECNYLDCLKETSISGLNTGTCEAVRSTHVCEMITGEAFELPHLRKAKNFAENARFLVQNIAPVTLRNIFANKLNKCSKEETDRSKTDLDIFLCHIPKTISQLVDYNSVTKSAGAFTYPDLPDICPEALDNEGRKPSSFLEGAYIPDKRFDDDPYLEEYRNNEPQYKAIVALIEYDEQLPEDMQERINRLMPTNPNNLHHIKELDIPDEGPEYDKEITIKYNERIDLVKEAIEKGVSHEDTTYDGAIAALLQFPIFSEQPAKEVELPPEIKRTQPIENEEDAKRVEEYIKELKKIEEERKDILLKIDGKRIQNEELKGALTKYQQKDEILDERTINVLEKLRSNGVISTNEYEEIMENSIGTTGPPLFLPTKDTEKILEETQKKFGLERDKNGKLKCSKETENTPCAKLNQYENKQRQERLAKMIDLGTRWAWDKLNLGKYIQLKEWPGIFGEIGGAADEYLSSDSWKESLCNPNSNINPVDNNPSTAYIRTQQGLYEPVLSFVAQKQNYEEEYLYSFTLMVGGVEQEYNLEIMFKGEETIRPGTKKLKENEVFTYSKAFLKDKEYNQMCIKFNEDFPNTISGNKEYCRKIVEAGAWNLGNPVKYDEEGNVIINEEEKEIWNLN